MENDEARTTLRDAVRGYTGLDEAQADEMLRTVARWWHWTPDLLLRIVRAFDGTLLPGPAVWWLYLTAALAGTHNGGELLLFAALRVAAMKGMAPEYVDLLREQAEAVTRHPGETSH